MEMMEKVLDNLENGNSKGIRESIKVVLDSGIHHQEILKQMLELMNDIGDKFRKNIIFVPEVLIIGRAFNVALEEIRPFIMSDEVTLGTMVIGTVHGDYHDVGKNIVKLFLESANVKVIDLGINVSANEFIDAVNEYNPDVLAMSALLTTTMIEMEKVITQIEEANLRDNMKIIIGGAPITENYALNIGADYYAKDAYESCELIKEYLVNK